MVQHPIRQSSSRSILNCRHRLCPLSSDSLEMTDENRTCCICDSTQELSSTWLNSCSVTDVHRKSMQNKWVYHCSIFVSQTRLDSTLLVCLQPYRTLYLCKKHVSANKISQYQSHQQTAAEKNIKISVRIVINITDIRIKYLQDINLEHYHYSNMHWAKLSLNTMTLPHT
jgi:hypothetical protein